MKRQVNLDIYSPEGPDFCPAALLRRTSVLPQAKPWRKGGFAALSIVIPKE